MAVVRLATQLREYAGGQAAIPVPGGTLGEVLAALEVEYPAIGRRVRDERGRVRRHVNVFVGNDRVLDLTTPVLDESEVSILPAVSGGQ